MSKNILIIGAQRCGKSSLANLIASKYHNYEILRGDPFLVTLSAYKSALYFNDNKQKFQSTDENTIILDDITITNNEATQFLHEFYSQMRIDLEPISKNLIIETMNLDVENAKKFFGEDFDIYCLGMPNENKENLLNIICETETYLDWTYNFGITRKKIICQHIINTSKILFQDCQKNNLCFFDTSGNREEKLAKALAEIELRSIKAL